MFVNISEKITNRLIQKNVIEDCNREIYLFGVEQFLTITLNIVTTIVIGLVLGKLWQSILFVLMFMVLRSYAGGYHASTPVGCYILTSSIITTALSVLKFIGINILVCVGLLIISGVAILILSPVQSENKPLDNIEFVIYRKKAIIVWMAEFMCAALCAIAGLKDMLMCILLAHIALVLSQLFAKVENVKILKSMKNLEQ